MSTESGGRLRRATPRRKTTEHGDKRLLLRLALQPAACSLEQVFATVVIIAGARGKPTM